MPERWMWDDRPKGEPTLSWDEGEASGPLAIGTMLMRVSDHEAQVEALQAEVERLREAGKRICAAMENVAWLGGPRNGKTELGRAWEQMCAALSPQPEERSDG